MNNCNRCRASVTPEESICFDCAQRALEQVRVFIEMGLIDPIPPEGPKTDKDFKEIRRPYRKFSNNFKKKEVINVSLESPGNSVEVRALGTG